MTAGLLGLMIPALLEAISCKVLPRVSQWSKPTVVIMLNRGLQMLTASSVPPKPPSAIYHLINHYEKIPGFPLNGPRNVKDSSAKHTRNNLTLFYTFLSFQTICSNKYSLPIFLSFQNLSKLFL